MIIHFCIHLSSFFLPGTAGVFVAEGVKAGRAQRLLIAADAFRFGHPGVGLQLGRGEKLGAGFLDAVFHPQPVEQGTLGLLLAGGEFDQAADA